MEVTEVIHGVSVSDPYQWLENGTDPEVQTWTRSQDAMTHARLAELPERAAIAQRLKELYYVERVSAPCRFGGNYFYSRRLPTQEKSAVVMRDGRNGSERVLVDPNGWSGDGTVSLGVWSPSWDGKKIAYTVRENNSDEAKLEVLDVASGKRMEQDVIEGARYAIPSWSHQGDGFYYVWVPTDSSIPAVEIPGFAAVRFHRLGTDPRQDPVVHGPTRDPRTFLEARASRDGRFLVVSILHGWNRTDVFFQDLRRPSQGWRPLVTGQDAVYEVEVDKGNFYVQTNEGAPRGRVFRVDPSHCERDRWQEVVAERKDASLQSHAVIGGRFVLQYLRDASSHVEVRDLNGHLAREVPLPALGTASISVGDPEEEEVYLSFTSFTRPDEIYRTNVRTGNTSLFHRMHVPVDTSLFSVEQVFVTSKDGTRLPVFIVGPKGFARDGKAPAILFGYGGFRLSVTPAFNSTMVPWIERGGIFVFPNLRGGSEYGERWHRAGMSHQKQNTFDDFIATAEYLVREHISSPDRLVIRGGSNGGLLVGAAITQRPDLFRVALCGVPLLDMVRYHRFGAGKTWIEEYGSADDPEDFKALYAYSPYHRVRAETKYPSVLILSADSDDRVDPMHARKFAAILQASSTGGPVLLRIEKHSGHGGADLVRAAVQKGADEFAFSLSEISK